MEKHKPTDIVAKNYLTISTKYLNFAIFTTATNLDNYICPLFIEISNLQALFK